MVDHSWSYATRPFLYRFLSIPINSPESLNEFTTQVHETELGKRYLHYARHLEISGQMVFRETGDEPGKQACSQPTKLKVGMDFILEEPLNPYFYQVFIGDGDLDTVEWHAEAWKPLVSLLGEFRHLSNLVYKCRSRFAPGLVTAIQQHHPACKIHLRHFRFKSLHDDITDPDELALAASPCLHSLSILNVWRDSNGVDDHNKDAALCTVSLAPNLKHVRMLTGRPASSFSLHRSRDRPKEPWKGFNPRPEAFRKASLESLSFCTYYANFSRSKLREWTQVADLTMLRRFSFALKDASVLPELMAYTRLSHLKELSITLHRKETDEEFQSIVERFISDLNPLTILELSGTLHEELLHAICQQHGSKMQRLVLRPYEDHYDMAGPPLKLQSTHMQLIARSCPRLSFLDVQIKRTRGDAMETACYEALGTIETLRTARIYLDCSNSTNSGNLNPDDQQLETALGNSAVDEILARSIWDVIGDGSKKQRLESLTVSSGGGSAFRNSHPGDLMTIVSHLSRSYHISRDCDHDVATIVELTKEGREQADEGQREHEQVMLEKWGRQGFDEPSFKVFDRLWPFKESGKDWRDVWRSWPLQRSV
jgi:hypothetical protein